VADSLEAVRRNAERGSLPAEPLAGPAGPDDLAARFVEVRRLSAQGRVREAQEAAAAVLDAALAEGRVDLVVQVRLFRGRLLCNLGDLLGADAELAALEPLRGSFTADDAARCLYLQAQQHFQRHETQQAEQGFAATLAAWQALGDEQGIAEAQSALGMALVKQGRNFEGLKLWRQALAYYEGQGDAYGTAVQLQRISFAAWCEADMESARRTLLHLLRLEEEHQGVLPPTLGMMANFNLSSVELFAGNLEAAEQYLETTRERAAAVGYDILVANLHIMQAALELRRQRPLLALAARDEALRQCAASGYAFTNTDHMHLALVLAANGDLEGARREWPVRTAGQPDREEAMHLREVLLVLEAVRPKADSPAAGAQLAQWQAELAALAGD
jgi:tetratricopeptide (TPR) repeat protein